MTIRAYNPQDLNDILTLLEELRGSNESGRFSNYLMDSRQYKEVYLTSKNYIVLVAIIDKRIIGFMISEHYCNDTAALTMLYVGLNFRRKGIAIALKEAMESICRIRGYKRIVSQVRTNNEESIRLNKKAGWYCHLDKNYPDYYYEFMKYL